MRLNLQCDLRQVWTVSLNHKLTAKKGHTGGSWHPDGLTHSLLEDLPKLSDPSIRSIRRLSSLHIPGPGDFWVLLDTEAQGSESAGRSASPHKQFRVSSGLSDRLLLLSVYKISTQLGSILVCTVPRCIYWSVENILKIPLTGNRLFSRSSAANNPNILKFCKIWKELESVRLLLWATCWLLRLLPFLPDILYPFLGELCSLFPLRRCFPAPEVIRLSIWEWCSHVNVLSQPISLDPASCLLWLNLWCWLIYSTIFSWALC